MIDSMRSLAVYFHSIIGYAFSKVREEEMEEDRSVNKRYHRYLRTHQPLPPKPFAVTASGVASKIILCVRGLFLLRANPSCED